MSTNMKRTLILLAILIESSIYWFPLSKSTHVPNAKVIVVPDDFQSIQAAINSASIGGRIAVKAGVYEGGLIIDKPLTIVGENGAKIVSNGMDHTIKIIANNVSLSGFVIEGVEKSIWSGIYIVSLSNEIQNNTVLGHCYGVHMYDSSGNVLRNNKIYGNKYDLEVWGLVLQHFLHDIDFTNQVNQRPVYYWVNKRDEQVPLDAGCVALVNCSNIVVKNLTLSNNGEGVLCAYTTNSTISNVTVFNNLRGIRLMSSDSNQITNSNILYNEWSGVTIDASKNTILHGNIISGNRQYGILASFSPLLPYFSKANKIVENKISNNNYGLFFDSSSDNVISVNMFNNTYCNIMLKDSQNSVFCGNLIIGSECGIRMQHSEDNRFHHNNFIENLIEVDIKDFLSTNVWDDGYPSGGNYWSDYNGLDSYSGYYQDIAGNDGIGDSPYIIDRDNRDNYPLKGMFSRFFVHWEAEEYPLDIVSNSTISNFRFDALKRMISFNVAGPDNTLGFWRVTIQDVMIQELWNNRFIVLMDGEELRGMKNWTDNIHTYLYFSYIHSEHEVMIIPEFSRHDYTFFLIVIIIPLLFVILFLLMRMRYLRRGSRNR